jgi:hypothetical protein
MAQPDDPKRGTAPVGNLPTASDGPARSAGPVGFAAAGPQAQVPRTVGPFEIVVQTSDVWGLTAAAIVFGLFSVLPLLHPISGAAGAFVATFVIVLGQRVVGRRHK